MFNQGKMKIEIQPINIIQNYPFTLFNKLNISYLNSGMIKVIYL